MILWQDATLKYRSKIVLEHINLELNKGEALAIVGSNNSGKTSFAKALSKQIPVFGSTIKNDFNVQFVPFHTTLDFGHGTLTYRQQRWNMIDRDVVPNCMEWLKKSIGENDASRLHQNFGMEHFTDAPIVQLSNGELRKMTLIKSMASNPGLLVIDNAFNGLDFESRKTLSDVFQLLLNEGVALVLTSVDERIVPSCFEKRVFIGEGENYTSSVDCSHGSFSWKKLPGEWNRYDDSIPLVELKNVSLKYGQRLILKDINWTLKSNEQWFLYGKNGSGKTSLLNLIFADNPKAYRQDISLFGNKKGSGESIWDIKEKIGFISPELHQFISGNSRTIEVIRTALYETNQKGKIQHQKYQGRIHQWLSYFNLTSISESKFNELSSSYQRVVLFIRALIKQPKLLILDEPFQGLDPVNVAKLKSFIDFLAQETDCAMVFVTHFPEEVPSSFRYQLELKNGGVEYCGEMQ